MGCCPPRRRSSAASRARSTRRARRTASRSSGSSSRSCPPDVSRAMRRASSTSVTAAWTDELREAYADRVVARLGESIQNLGTATLKRVVLSPVDLEAPQLQPGRRRHLRRLVCARPEPSLASARGGARPRHGRRRALAYRREHAPGTRSRRRLRPARRERADEGAAASAALCKASRTIMRFSLSEISTVSASFAEDVRAYAAAGFDGIGIWEMKLPGDDAATASSSSGPGWPSRTACRRCRRFCRSRSRAWKGRRTRSSGSRRSAPRSAAWPSTSPSASSASPARWAPAEAEGRAIVVDGLQRAAATARDVRRDAGVRAGPPLAT